MRSFELQVRRMVADLEDKVRQRRVRCLMARSNSFVPVSVHNKLNLEIHLFPPSFASILFVVSGATSFCVQCRVKNKNEAERTQADATEAI